MHSRILSLATFLIIVAVAGITVYFAITSTQGKGASADWSGCECACTYENGNLTCMFDGIACPGYIQNTTCQPK